jgi:type VI secretion system protein VasD
VAAAFAGCASAPKPTQISGSIEASAQLNLDSRKRPSPVVLRVYELKTAAAFNGADFVSLFERDQAVLGADLVGREEVIVRPGDTLPIAAKTLAPDVRFIGVMAAFRELERAQWRSIVEVLPGQKQRLVIRADNLSVSATVTK